MNPLCFYERPCKRNGHVVYGPWEHLGACDNRTMRCDKCGCHGEQSVNLTLVKAKPLPLFDEGKA